MDKNIFKFKQFDVNQAGCAMKINTDGVLLATLVNQEDYMRILDIGTGTGVIALMLAQRFIKAKVHAVEIDAIASATAEKNFRNAIFSERLTISNIAIENYNDVDQFDLIISNPPYFVNDLRNTEEKKGIARHAGNHFFQQLIIKVDELLAQSGCFWFILPVKQAESLIKEAERLGLYVSKQIHLHSDQMKPAFRWIVCLSRLRSEAEVTNFYIYEAEKVYTQDYKELLKDFFLDY